MKIATLHTTHFAFASPSTKLHAAAETLVRAGADNLRLVVEGIDPSPMPENAEPGSMRSQARVSGDDHESVQVFCSRIAEMLEWIGVEVSPREPDS